MQMGERAKNGRKGRESEMHRSASRSLARHLLFIAMWPIERTEPKGKEHLMAGPLCTSYLLASFRHKKLDTQLQG